MVAMLIGCWYSLAHGKERYARRKGGCAAQANPQALVKMLHQPGFGVAASRAATSGARFMRRSTGTVGTWAEKWRKSLISRRGSDSGREKPVGFGMAGASCA